MQLCKVTSSKAVLKVPILPIAPRESCKSNPSIAYLSAHQNKAAYQTPKYLKLPKKNSGKKCLTEHTP